jgi:hypothetical protein
MVSFVGNDLFEYSSVVVIRGFSSCIDRMDNIGLDDVGGCFCETCFWVAGTIAER